MWDEFLWEMCYLVHIMDLCPHLFGLSTHAKRQSDITEVFDDPEEVQKTVISEVCMCVAIARVGIKQCYNYVWY